MAAITLWLLLPSRRRFCRPRALFFESCYVSTFVCFVIATKITMSANAIFLQSTSPIYVLLLAPRLLGESNRRSDYVVTLLLIIGPETGLMRLIRGLFVKRRLTGGTEKGPSFFYSHI